MLIRNTKARISSLSKKKKAWLFSLPLMALVSVNALKGDGLSRTIDLSIPDTEWVQSIVSEPAEFQNLPDYEYVIRRGDTLSKIFEQLGFGYSELMKVMETDLNYLALDTLRPGNTLRFWKSEIDGS